MYSDFISHIEKQHLVPIPIETKQQYYLDLLNIEDSWTGRLDAQIANTFILESNQLLINSILLFEKGYFDCAFYSLRQSLEVSTTMLYLFDNLGESREEELNKWKSQSRFPMYGQMVKFLENNESVFADIKEKMFNFFEDLNSVKQKLNKYVHKQGFSTFYITKNHPLNPNKDLSAFTDEYESYLRKCIGAVAILRLAIDPFPVLLSYEQIYARTGDLMTQGYGISFIEKYIGFDNLEDYKKTEIYINHYDSIIQEEAKEPSVLKVVKNRYIDKTEIETILKQSHLLSKNDLTAVVLCSFSSKVAKIYCMGGLPMYFSSTDSNRKSWSWSSKDFNDFQENKTAYNQQYDKAFISVIELKEEVYFIEHNEKFSESEILELEMVKTIHRT